VTAVRPLRCELYKQVCDLLFDEWDPIGVNEFAPRDEYDSYAAGLIRLVHGGGDEGEVVAMLGYIARESIGLSHVDAERDRVVARRLIALVRG
jgi:hypothetical protein